MFRAKQNFIKQEENACIFKPVFEILFGGYATPTKCVAFWRLALNSYKNSSFLREKSDYDDFFIASKKDSEMQLEGAREFLGAVEAYYKQYKDWEANKM